MRRERWNPARALAFVQHELSARMEGAVGQHRDEAWEKAAACEAHAKATNDGKLQAMFRKLRDSWIRIGNKAQFEYDVAANAERLKSGPG
jgi:hypothetical protein